MSTQDVGVPIPETWNQQAGWMIENAETGFHYAVRELDKDKAIAIVRAKYLIADDELVIVAPMNLHAFLDRFLPVKEGDAEQVEKG